MTTYFLSRLCILNCLKELEAEVAPNYNEIVKINFKNGYSKQWHTLAEDGPSWRGILQHEPGEES